MDWFQQNWFWLLVGLLFVVMHLGHGGHGGHGRARPRNAEDGAPSRDIEEASQKSGHRH